MKQEIADKLITLQLKAERIDRLNDMLLCLRDDGVHVVFGRKLPSKPDEPLRWEAEAEWIALPTQTEALAVNVMPDDDESTAEPGTVSQVRDLLIRELSATVSRLEAEITAILEPVKMKGGAKA